MRGRDGAAAPEWLSANIFTQRGQTLVHGRCSRLVALSEVATVVSVLVTLTGIAYEYGRRRERKAAYHDEMEGAHYRVHQTLVELVEAVNEMNGHEIDATTKNCEMCDRAEED